MIECWPTRLRCLARNGRTVSEERDANDGSGGGPESDGYLVEVKPSARKSNADVGRWVNRHGPTRRFESRSFAREWARECAGPGAFVWIQDAVPWDDGDADGYLVGGARWRTAADAPPGDQARLGDR